MGLADVVRSGVATINKVTDSLQPYVTLKRWKSASINGDPLYASPERHKAIVDQTRKMRRTSSGEIVMTSASVMFVKPIAPLGTDDRKEPVDPRDVIILPDGTTNPIVDVSGFVDAGTGRPFFSEILLG